jgi:hypothetical protein
MTGSIGWSHEGSRYSRTELARVRDRGEEEATPRASSSFRWRCVLREGSILRQVKEDARSVLCEQGVCRYSVIGPRGCELDEFFRPAAIDRDELKTADLKSGCWLRG